MQLPPQRPFRRSPRLSRAGLTFGPVLLAMVLVASIATSVNVAARRALDLPAPLPRLDVLVYGPEQFSIPSGGTALHVENFGVTYVPGTRYRIDVANGNGGSNEVDAALITINGVELHSGSLAGGLTSVEFFGLLASNEMVLDLDGPNGSFVAVSIYQLDHPTTTIFGPVELIRTTGAPDEDTYVFDLPEGVVGPFGLHVNSGFSDGSSRATAAWVDLDSAVVFEGEDFGEEVGYLEAEVALQDSGNVLDLRIAGRRGSRIEVFLTGVVSDTTAPVITILAPEGGLITDDDSVDVLGTVADESAVAVDVNGITAQITDDTLFSARVPLTSEGLNVITATATDASRNEAVATVTVTRDNTTPALTVTAPVDQLVTAVTPTPLVGQATDVNGVDVNVNGDPVPTDTTGAFADSVDLDPGVNVLTVTATDPAGNQAVEVRTVTLDQDDPFLTVEEPEEGLVTNDPDVTVSGSVTDATAVTVEANAVPLVVTAGLFEGEVTLAEGPNLVTVTATDAAGNEAQVMRGVTVDTEAPGLVVNEPTDGSSTTADSVDVSGTVTDATDVTLTLNGVGIAIVSDAFATRIALNVGPNVLAFLAVDEAGNETADTVTVTRGDGLPPDPSLVASAVAPNVATTIGAATAFLYEGEDPIQTGVAPGTIDPVRVVVVRGRVMDRDSVPVTGVTVSINGHPEFGQTLTRADGWYDLALNGGGVGNVRFVKAGYPEVQRRLELPWQDYIVIDDVVMVPLDTAVTTIDFSDPIEVARGSPQTDADGTRQATLMFRQGTLATIDTGSGIDTLTSISVRATEYTVGATGPEAMPAALPPTSGYTYAVELSADEAIAAGAERLEFTQGVPVYLENFLGFPVGLDVPNGYFDRSQGEWFAEPDGRVIEVVDTAGGVAALDIDTIAGAESTSEVLAELGITEDELEAVAATYAPGDELWRVEVTHFSAYDWNWPRYPPEGAEFPPEPDPTGGDESDPEDPCEAGGSIIGCESQALREIVPVVGTPFSLNYSSLRVPGRRSAYQVEIPLTGDSVPPLLTRVELTILVAGERYGPIPFAPDPNVSYTFEWDGRDAYDREVAGEQRLTAVIGYAYGAVYQAPAMLFASFGGQSGGGGAGGGGVLSVPAREEAILTRTWQGSIGGRFVGSPDAHAQPLGGWTFDVHHGYDPIGERLLLGTGEVRSAAGIGQIIETIAGTGAVSFNAADTEGKVAKEAPLTNARDVAVASDGRVFVLSGTAGRVWEIGTDGITRTFVGSGPYLATTGLLADSVNFAFHNLTATAVAADGSVWISASISSESNLYRVRPDGIIEVYGGPAGYAGDGGPVGADTVRFGSLLDVAAGADGSMYLMDGHRVRRIGPEGRLSTIAGTGSACNFGPCGNGGAATQAAFNSPRAVAVGPDGSVYVADVGLIRRITPDGFIGPFAGTGGLDYTGDGGPAVEAQIGIRQNAGLAVGPDGSVFYSQGSHGVVRKIDPRGIISTVAGDGIIGYLGDGGRALAARLRRPAGLAVDQEGGLIIADVDDHRVRRVGASLPGFDAGEHLIPSDDRSVIYRFTADGQHLETIWARTGATLYTFEYDSLNRLERIVDADSMVTTIGRNVDDEPETITGPYGQVTELAIDARGYLASVVNPAGETFAFTTDTLGLVTAFVTPTADTTRIAYDSIGRVVEHTDAVGRVRTWERTESADTIQVALTTPAGTTTYRTIHLSDGTIERVVEAPTGEVSRTVIAPDGVDTSVGPDSVRTTAYLFPAGSAVERGIPGDSVRVETPSGLTSVRSLRRAVTTADSSGLELVTGIADTVRVNGRLSTATWTRSTNETVTRSAEGRETTTSFDALGRLVRSEFPGVEPTVLTRDALGRLELVEQGAKSWTYAYDSLGRVSASTDPLSRVVEFDYDAANRIVRQLFPDSSEVRFGYDAAGRLDSLVTPGSSVYKYLYAPDGRITRFIPPDSSTLGGAVYLSYDSVGQPSRLETSGGRVVEFTYDASGRITASPAGADTVEYVYDPVSGNLEQITSGTEQLTYTTDGDLITEVTSSGSAPGSIEFAYTDDFWLEVESVNGADSVVYSYDNDGLLVGAGLGTLANDATTGFLESYTLAGLATAFTYNGFGELAGDATTISGFGEVSFRYARDALGRVTADTTVIGPDTLIWAYDYDLLGQLETVELNGSPYATYGYDAGGNRTSVVDGSGSRTMTVNAQDQATGFGGASYEYDGAGLLERKVEGADTTTFTYDAFGNLTAVELPDGTDITYTIDPLQRRVATTVDGVVTERLLYRDGLEPIAELDSLGAVVTRFVYGARSTVPDYMERGGSTYRILSDQRGSVRVVVDVATDSVVQRMDYGPWGEVLVDTNPGFQPFGFAGGLYTPETGLVRFGARDYDPELGRWTAKDPLLFDGGDTNLYVYAGNDPINFVDPSGQFLWDVLDIYFFYKDLREFGRCPSIGNGLWALAGVAGLLPGIPNFGLIRRADKAAEAGRVFWSGSREARAAAEAFARATGGRTLEMTVAGRILDAITNRVTQPFLRPLWNAASRRFAAGARGAVDVFHSASNGVRLGSTWATVEYRALREGVEIIYHTAP